jgi:hypothetical protein
VVVVVFVAVVVVVVVVVMLLFCCVNPAQCQCCHGDQKLHLKPNNKKLIKQRMLDILLIHIIINIKISLVFQCCLELVQSLFYLSLTVS